MHARNTVRMMMMIIMMKRTSVKQRLCSCVYLICWEKKWRTREQSNNNQTRHERNVYMHYTIVPKEVPKPGK